jgi:hypothetical protein
VNDLDKNEDLVAMKHWKMMYLDIPYVGQITLILHDSNKNVSVFHNSNGS